MGNLDHRQIQILDKMGIDIWCRRVDNQGRDADADSGENPGENPGEDSGGDAERLQQLAETIGKCEKCPLHGTRTMAVPGVGSPFAKWMFVGEAPGHNEDLQGLPFVGRAGQLLDAMIAALKMQRKDVFIANVIKCRPPGNRNPMAAEIDQCEPYLHQQLAIIKPAIIVALGAVSAQALLKTTQSIGQIRGKVYRYGESDIPLVPTYHPAYLLRSPGQKGKTWEDLLLAKSIVCGDD